MSNYELTYHLKQESPIIHFQNSVPGATLRASDVKPRMDKFIKEWCCRKHTKEFEKWDKEWKISGDKNAYNYKLSIALEKDNVSSRPLTGIYFGNMGKNSSNNGECCLWSDGGLELRIVCFYPKLLGVIDECIRTFFLINNFGTRSSRGYGSFVIKDNDCENYSREELLENINLIKEWYSDRTIFKIEHDKSIGNTINDVLMEGQYVYQILKSGYNNGRDTYIKSFLVEYFLDNNIIGEKRFCKQERIVPSIKNDRQNITSDKKELKPYYIRAILGHGENSKYKETKDDKGYVFWEVINADRNANLKNDWAKPSNTDNYEIVDTNKGSVKLVFSNKKPKYETSYGINKNIKVNNITDTLTIKNNSMGKVKIDRIPSPILYKVINKEIYIIPKDINLNIGGADFVFKVKQGDNSRWKLVSSEKHLRIPRPCDIGNFESYNELLNDIMCKYAEKFNTEISRYYKVKKNERNYSLSGEKNNDGTKIRKV